MLLFRKDFIFGLNLFIRFYFATTVDGIFNRKGQNENKNFFLMNRRGRLFCVLCVNLFVTKKKKNYFLPQTGHWFICHRLYRLFSILFQHIGQFIYTTISVYLLPIRTIVQFVIAIKNFLLEVCLLVPGEFNT